MDARSILVLLAERFGAEAALQHAAIAAQALPDAAITALHVRVDPLTTIIPTEEVMPEGTERAMLREAAEEGATIRVIFDAWAGQRPRGLPASWEDLVGTEEDQIKQHAASAALLVMAAPAAKTRGHALLAFHTALFDVQKPLLAVPVTHRAARVARILVGWKDSDVSRRAIEAAAPWLRRAETVEVVRVGEADQGELAAAEQLLADIGVRATARAVAQDGLSNGRRLLAEAASMNADWLVMGAYRHNRFVESLVGGVTRTVLREARLPLFLLH